MNCCSLALGRATFVLAVLTFVKGPVWAQGPGSPFPYSGYSFGSTYPYWGEAPSSYGGGLGPYQGIGASLRPLNSSLSSPPMFGRGSSLQGHLGIELSSPSALSSALLSGSQRTPQPDKRAHIWLHVPVEAEVWFDGAKSQQTGPLRYYVTPSLTPGKSYGYQVQVRWRKDGQPVERRQRIDVRAGGSLHVDLTQKAPG
jgi:uncharacterized protein (TIGR03000 family)